MCIKTVAIVTIQCYYFSLYKSLKNNHGKIFATEAKGVAVFEP